MSDLREAMDQILIICNGSRTYTRRTQTIHDVAMRALGLTAGQRDARHMAIMQRTGGQFSVEAYIERCAKREAKSEQTGTPP